LWRSIRVLKCWLWGSDLLLLGCTETRKIEKWSVIWCNNEVGDRGEGGSFRLAEHRAVSNETFTSVLNVYAMADAAPRISKTGLLYARQYNTSHVLDINLVCQPSTSFVAMLRPPGLRNRQ
jgi:hypothetical protein